MFGCCVHADLVVNEAVSCQGYVDLGLEEYKLCPESNETDSRKFI